MSTFRKWLDLPDAGTVEVMMGAYTANRLAGDPVWLLLVGPPSGGKGEVINSCEDLPYMHRAAQVSEASLLSGSTRDNRSDDATGGLLKDVGEFGILVMKDFTSIFTMNREERGKALSALRHCYDGSFYRPVGAEGGRVLKWHGKLGVVGGVTEAIDTETSVMSRLGPRFLLFRLPPGNAIKQAQCAIDTREREPEMRLELSRAVRLFFEHLDFQGHDIHLSETDRNWLVALVTLAVCCRSHVERNAYNREIEQVPESEGPGRMMRAIGQLWAGLALIGVRPERRRELVQKVALDSMPPIRRIAFDYLVANGMKQATTGEIARTCRYPEQTLRRALQDLRCHNVVQSRKVGTGKSEYWSIAAAWRKQCSMLVKVAPKTVNRTGECGRVGCRPEDRSDGGEA